MSVVIAALEISRQICYNGTIMITSNDFEDKENDEKEAEVEEAPKAVKKAVGTKTVKKARKKAAEAKPKKESSGSDGAKTEPFDNRVLVKMRSGGSWTTAEGVTFNRTHPFQLCSPFEAQNLCNQNRFRKATKDELKEFYDR